MRYLNQIHVRDLGLSIVNTYASTIIQWW